jgi:hypothetical protein
MGHDEFGYSDPDYHGYVPKRDEREYDAGADLDFGRSFPLVDHAPICHAHVDGKLQQVSAEVYARIYGVTV